MRERTKNIIGLTLCVSAVLLCSAAGVMQTLAGHYWLAALDFALVVVNLLCAAFWLRRMAGGPNA